MAARIEPAYRTPLPDLLDLRQVSSPQLAGVLEEEIASWRSMLHWDFTKSADLVRRFVDMRALQGCALALGGDVAGYSYYVLEEHKGLIGDLYVRREHRSIDAENRLLEAVLQSLIQTPHVTRVESQLMMIGSSGLRRIPLSHLATAFERCFMMLNFANAPALPPGRAANRTRMELWSEHYQEPASRLIAAAYVGHTDSKINDQYRSAAGARKFLFNIVQYPGCGSFFRPASFVAFDPYSGALQGISLASLVAAETGHITQVCVAPELRGTGLGYELLRQSLESLRRARCKRVSLTVTASNTGAIALYERLGFRTIRTFSACVWEGF